MIDIFAINAYIEIEFFTDKGINPYPPNQDISLPPCCKRESSNVAACTQFAAWGDQTELSNLKGKLVVGRNMDGELDVRKVTVSHVTIFAIEPTESKLKYVSIMWPGFVGTLSSVNEQGVYGMMNVGSVGDGISVHGATPVNWLLRQVLASVSPQDFTPQNVQNILESMKSKEGGACVSGCVLFFANPYTDPTKPPAFAYESDFAGKKMIASLLFFF